MGTRSFNVELCNDLWNEPTQWAGDLSFYYCPQLIFPTDDLSSKPKLLALHQQPPTRLRSAFLTQYFWDGMLKGSKNEVIDMLSDDVCYYTGSKPGTCGKQQGAQTLPYIGFPKDSEVTQPVKWRCDTQSCIAPVKAWASHTNFCLTAFAANGKATE